MVLGVERVRYIEVREQMLALIANKWFTYYKGNIAVARKSNREIDLVARAVYGLAATGRICAMQRRNAEGVIEYRMYPLGKLLGEDFDAAMAVTSKSGMAYIPPITDVEYKAWQAERAPRKLRTATAAELHRQGIAA